MSTQPQAVSSEEPDVDEAAVSYQTLRREVNERIATLNPESARLRPETIDAICECAYAGCTGKVSLPVAEYEAIRRFPTRFLVKAGHEVSKFDRIVGESDAYVVVEKVGSGGSYAVRVDPRRRSTSRREGAAA